MACFTNLQPQPVCDVLRFTFDVSTSHVLTSRRKISERSCKPTLNIVAENQNYQVCGKLVRRGIKKEQQAVAPFGKCE
jgi:hypothetical protein